MKKIVSELKDLPILSNVADNKGNLKMRDSSQTSNFIRQNWLSPAPLWDRESFGIICFNFNYEITYHNFLFVGGRASTVADVAVIMRIALAANASSIIVYHNHPSGNLRPSNADELLTKRLQKACDTLTITLADHIILTEGSYYSFAENGYL